jgi:hypothetical protein
VAEGDKINLCQVVLSSSDRITEKPAFSLLNDTRKEKLLSLSYLLIAYHFGKTKSLVLGRIGELVFLSSEIVEIKGSFSITRLLYRVLPVSNTTTSAARI